MKGPREDYKCEYEQKMENAQKAERFQDAYAAVPADGRSEEKFSPLVKKGK